MLKIGIVGFGFMGRMHYRCWRQLHGVAITALCDTDPRAVKDSVEQRGNIAGAEEDVDLAGVTIYGDIHTMLRQESLDAVSITVPTHLHPSCAIAAMEAGAHVLCEKPIALNLTDGARMIDVAQRAGKLLQIGHCIRFWPEYAKAKQIVDAGQYGWVVAATFQRLAATAARKANSWFVDPGRSGGMALDVHVHDADFIQHLFGMPRAVRSAGAMAAGRLDHIVTQYVFDDDALVTAEGGWAMMPSYGFDMRFHIVLERATLDFDFRRVPTLRLCLPEGEAIEPPCEKDDGYSRQVAHFAQRIRGKDVPPVITPQEAWNSLRIVLTECESARTGREVAIAGTDVMEGNHAL